MKVISVAALILSAAVWLLVLDADANAQTGEPRPAEGLVERWVKSDSVSRFDQIEIKPIR